MKSGTGISSPTSGAVRAALLINQPIQHFAPALRVLARQPELHTRVYYWHAPPDGLYDRGFGRHVRWSTDLYGGYRWWAPPRDRAPHRRRLVAWRRLRADRPEVILCFGWASQISRVGIAYAAFTRTPLFYYGDTNGRTPADGLRPALRAAVLRRLFRRAAGALSTGTFNRDFYLAHGLRPEQIHPGVYPIDLDPFHAAGDRRPTGTADPAGERPLVIGFAGKLIPIKAADDLVEAARRLDRNRPWEVRVIGDGPLRPRLEATVTRYGLAERVRFLGFRNSDELPGQMSEIDIMVMPSHREPRGLVPIEAMAAGAAVIVSSATGVWGPGDAVAHGLTGLVYPAADIGALTGCLQRLMDDPALRRRLAVAGRQRVRSFGPADFASTVTAALATATRRVVDAPLG